MVAEVGDGKWRSAGIMRGKRKNCRDGGRRLMDEYFVTLLARPGRSRLFERRAKTTIYSWSELGEV